MHSRRLLVFVLSAIIVVAAIPGNSWATRVGLFGADAPTGIVRAYLVATGLFNASEITYSDVRNYTPTVAELAGYDVVMVWSNSYFYDRYGFGDNLADYIDLGGGVVLACKASTEGGAGFNYSIRGRITDYMPWTAGKYDGTQRSLGSYDATSPLMCGVDDLTASYWDNVTLKAGAVLVASWNNGVPAVAWSQAGQLVGIGCYPNESSTMTEGDFATLFANALIFASNAPYDNFPFVAETGVLSVHVELQDYDISANRALSPVEIRLIPKMWGATRTDLIVLDASGNYVLNDVVAGTYDVLFSACKWLTEKVSCIVVPTAGQGRADAVLPNGDLDGDNHITSTDGNIVLKNMDRVGDF